MSSPVHEPSFQSPHRTALHDDRLLTSVDCERLSLVNHPLRVGLTQRRARIAGRKSRACSNTVSSLDSHIHEDKGLTPAGDPRPENVDADALAFADDL